MTAAEQRRRRLGRCCNSILCSGRASGSLASVLSGGYNRRENIHSPSYGVISKACDTLSKDKMLVNPASCSHQIELSNVLMPLSRQTAIFLASRMSACEAVSRFTFPLTSLGFYFYYFFFCFPFSCCCSFSILRMALGTEIGMSSTGI